MTKHGLRGSFALVAAVSALLIGFPALAQEMYVLDGFGGVHAVNAAPVITPTTPYFGFDVAEAIEVLPGGAGYYVLDAFGGVHDGGNAPNAFSPPPYFGFDVARDLSLVPGTEAGIDYTAQSTLAFNSLATCFTYGTIKSLTLFVPPATTTRYVSCRATGRGSFVTAGKYVLFLIGDSSSTGDYDQFTYTGVTAISTSAAYDDFAMQKVYTVGTAGGTFGFYLKACRQDTATRGTAYMDDLICNVIDTRY